MSGKVPPPYSPEVRLEAVRLVREGGATPTEAARTVGCSVQTIHNWVLQHERDTGVRTDGLTTDERAELAFLCRAEQGPRAGKGDPEKSRGLVRQGERLDPMGAFEFV
jgi:transposase-like protein